MKNKKKLGAGKYAEEDLTKVRSSIYYAVRKNNSIINAWTKEGKILGKLKDTEQILTFITPDDLKKLGLSDDEINKITEPRRT